VHSEKRRHIEQGTAVVLAALAFYALAEVFYFGTAETGKKIDKAYALTGGNVENGRTVIVAKGCGACHQIPGIVSARGQVGPTLQGVAGRAMIGGVVPNTPDNLVRWVENPRALNEKTAMPVLGVTRKEAEDIAAYLYARSG
jgi:cytochrome c2